MKFDAIVIGAGPAGEVVAGDLADGGLKTAVVERELVAGECSYWACIPTKTLLRPGEALAGARGAPGAREAVTGELDPESAFEWRNFMVSDYDDSAQVKWLEEKGIELFRGAGRLDGPGRVRVGDQVHDTTHVVIATGSDPVIPPVPGLQELGGVWTNREASAVKELPGRILILGGGPVGVEFAQAFRRMGASVALVESNDRVLAREAETAGRALTEILEAEGVELRLGARATGAGRHGDGYSLSFDDSPDLVGDKLLVATGRRARVSNLGLESVGLPPEAKRIEVDEHLNAGENLWAIGDVTGIWPFTHVGKYQARIAAHNILGDELRADYSAVPRVIFTDPQVAAVGTHEGERTGTVQLAEIARTSTYMREYDRLPAFLTLVADGDRLVGAYAVGPEAGEWIGQATLAVRARVPIAVLRDTIQPFPTFSEAFVSALADLAR